MREKKRIVRRKSTWVASLPGRLVHIYRRTGPVLLGGLRSVARIFYPLLARKSSGFARILHHFLPENGYLRNSRGLQPPAPPPAPASYAYACSPCMHGLFFIPSNFKITRFDNLKSFTLSFTMTNGVSKRSSLLIT